jgi:hypothetical protein
VLSFASMDCSVDCGGLSCQVNYAVNLLLTDFVN